MTRRFFILSGLLIFIAAPAVGIVTASFTQRQNAEANLPQDTVTKASKDELLDAIVRYNDSLPDYQKIPGKVDSIIEVKTLEKWWYIVTVRITYEKVNENDKGYVDAAMLLSKFNNQPNSITAITNPGEPFPRLNISDGRGVPYTVIDELNKSLKITDQGDNDEH